MGIPNQDHERNISVVGKEKPSLIHPYSNFQNHVQPIPSKDGRDKSQRRKN